MVESVHEYPLFPAVPVPGAVHAQVIVRRLCSRKLVGAVVGALVGALVGEQGPLLLAQERPDQSQLNVPAPLPV